MLNKVFFHNEVRIWLAFAGSCIISFIVVLGLRRLFVFLADKAHHSRGGLLSKRWEYFFAAMSSAIHVPILAVAVIGYCTNLLSLPVKLDHLVSRITTLAVFIQIAILFWKVLNVFFDYYLDKITPKDATDFKASYAILKFAVRLVVFTFLILSALDNLGFEVKTLIAGLGIGGIAIALAVQNVFGDILSSLAIVLDKPFELGDAIAVDQINGTVERIGIKTTRIRSLSGEQIIISNSDLLRSRILNFKRQDTRRVAFQFRIPVLADQSLVVKINSSIKSAATKIPKVNFDRSHLARVVDGTFEFEVVYIIQSADYTLFMDIQQQVLVEIAAILRSFNVSFADPRQKVLLEEQQLENFMRPSSKSPTMSLPLSQ